MKLWVYDVGIIDWWIGWTPLEKAEFYEDDGIENSFREHAEAVLSLGKVVAKDAFGWEGDMREGPYISGLPDDDFDVALMIGWKQDNNGQTFVCSERPLSWLERDKDRFVQVTGDAASYQFLHGGLLQRRNLLGEWTP